MILESDLVVWEILGTEVHWHPSSASNQPHLHILNQSVQFIWFSSLMDWTSDTLAFNHRPLSFNNARNFPLEWASSMAGKVVQLLRKQKTGQLEKIRKTRGWRRSGSFLTDPSEQLPYRRRLLILRRKKIGFHFSHGDPRESLGPQRNITCCRSRC